MNLRAHNTWLFLFLLFASFSLPSFSSFSSSSFSSFNYLYFTQADIDTATEATRQRAATQRRGYEEDMKDMSLKNAELIGEETHTRIAYLLAFA